MIEPTDEMLWAALDAYDQYCPDQRSEEGFRLALAAVLAIIERDYYVGERIPLHCGVPGPGGLTCQRTPKHLTAHAAQAPGDPGELVIW